MYPFLGVIIFFYKRKKNGMNNKKILSICIPIYDREAYLERMLSRFEEDKELFDEKIELIISDNHSKDNLELIIKKYQNKGLNLNYFKQIENLGPDGNFLFCFSKATGRYCWLLGSDDIPTSGFLKYLIQELEIDMDFGLVFLRLRQFNEKWYRYEKTKEIYSEIQLDNQKMISDINVYITFMSSSIFKTETLQSLDLRNYMGTNLIQVPVYVKSCLTSDKNLIINYNYCFEVDKDNVNTGNYNLFKVLIVNLFAIMQQFVEEGLLSKDAFERFKKKEYKSNIIQNTFIALILKKDKIHNLEGGWRILWKYYGKKLYAYTLFADFLVKSICSKIMK